ncbi:type II toxin-antitoxin system VapC family toxin [Actinopolymorpha alba]|uniref:type II toxin-antitoxin system VapC family toxin n=1 Tax=Actinopolymorpha alba TaxID=533267 RepID=UPI00037D23E9|nr:type II toxin-antitoxin system VapC family toxin [Actinopolymorpha alba]
MIYLDSAAVVKLVRMEAESNALHTWLQERPHARVVASALVEVEVPRALYRADPLALAGVNAVIARLDRVEIDLAVRATAAAYQDPGLRSLDAIQLATAELLAGDPDVDELEAFVTYDKRLLASAAAVGLPALSPGMEEVGPAEE